VGGPLSRALRASMVDLALVGQTTAKYNTYCRTRVIFTQNKFFQKNVCKKYSIENCGDHATPRIS